MCGAEKIGTNPGNKSEAGIARGLLTKIIEAMRDASPALSGEDSPLADPWEEVKEQVQHGLWPGWPVYYQAIMDEIDSAISALSAQDAEKLARELKLVSSSNPKTRQAIFKKLIARAKKEKVCYLPLEFEYFFIRGSMFCIYGRVIERTEPYQCRIQGFSPAAPTGEFGEVSLANIDGILTKEQFEQARQNGWPQIPQESREI